MLAWMREVLMEIVRNVIFLIPIVVFFGFAGLGLWLEKHGHIPKGEGLGFNMFCWAALAWAGSAVVCYPYLHKIGHPKWTGIW